jgi:hypothetical protein
LLRLKSHLSNLSGVCRDPAIFGLSWHFAGKLSAGKKS